MSNWFKSTVSPPHQPALVSGHDDAPNWGVPSNVGMRFGAASLLAGGITLGLFAMMQALVYVKDIKTVEGASRVLATLTPMHKDEAVKRRVRKVVTPTSVVTPPALPATRNTRTVPSMPTVTIDTPAPRMPTAGKLMSFSTPSAFLDRKAVPMSPPNVQYPRAMATKGMSGKCEVTFSLSVRGLPFDPVATCTHTGFESAALRAVKNAEFLPQIGENGPIEAHGMIYPIEFLLK